MSQMRGLIGLLMFGALGWAVGSDTPAGFTEVSSGAAVQVRGGSTPDPACQGYTGSIRRCCTGSFNNFTDVYQVSTTTKTAKPLNTPPCGLNNDRACFANQYNQGQRCS
jgi:hypothetical protein